MTTEFGDCPLHQFVVDSNHNWDKSMNKIVEELGKKKWFLYQKAFLRTFHTSFLTTQ